MVRRGASARPRSDFWIPAAVDAEATITHADARSHVTVRRRSTAIDHLPEATLPDRVRYFNRIGVPFRTQDAHRDITGVRNCLFNRELNLVTPLHSKPRNASIIELVTWLVMQAVKSSSGSFRFGRFELDTRSGDLLNNGTTNRLADQPLALLIALLERPGELITRDELRQRLWPDGTFVDFDHGLNSAVNRLREALNDTAHSPRFVETVPRRGYRLLVPVTSSGTQPPESSEGSAPTGRQRRTPARRRARVASRGPESPLRQSSRPAPRACSTPTRSRPGAAARERGHRPAGRLVHPQSVAGHISRQSVHCVSGLHRDGRRGLLMRPLGSGAAHALPLTEDGSDPFWAPDSATIGFFAEGKLKMLPVAGGPPRIICDAPADSGGTFLSPGIVLFGPGPAGTIMQVDVERGTLRTVTTLDAGAGDRGTSAVRCRLAVTSSIWRSARTASSQCSRRSAADVPSPSAPWSRTCCPRARAMPCSCAMEFCGLRSSTWPDDG